MAYCRKCRTHIPDGTMICPHCEAPQQEQAAYLSSSTSSAGQSSDGAASSTFLIIMSILLIILGLLGLFAAPKGLLLSAPCLLGAAAMIASLVKRKKAQQQMVENMSRAAANNSAPVTQTAAPAKKSNAQAIIGVIAVLIVALGFASYRFNLFGPKGSSDTSSEKASTKETTTTTTTSQTTVAVASKATGDRPTLYAKATLYLLRDRKTNELTVAIGCNMSSSEEFLVTTHGTGNDFMESLDKRFGSNGKWEKTSEDSKEYKYKFVGTTKDPSGKTLTFITMIVISKTDNKMFYGLFDHDSETMSNMDVFNYIFT